MPEAEGAVGSREAMVGHGSQRCTPVFTVNENG